MNEPLLEICTGDPAGVLAAIKGGADRVELCAGLAEGGLTPSAAMIRWSAARIPTNVLIRPRAGDFVYTPEELDVMEQDIAMAIGLGAHGVVFGALTPDFRVDKEACMRLLAIADGVDTTFHRAFDLTADPYRALEDIIELGFRRILTSGQKSTALDGFPLIRSLRRQAAGRINIMAGAGVNPENAADILRYTGSGELHASARSLHFPTYSLETEVAMGSAENTDGSHMATDLNIVAAIRKAMKPN